MPSIVKLLVDDKGYNAKIKQAASVFSSFASQIIGAKGQFNGLTKAIQQSTLAQQAFNAVMKKNPAGLVATAATFAMDKLLTKLTEAGEEQRKIAEAAQERAEREKAENDKVVDSVADVITQYQLLKEKWMSLSSEQEKAQWVKENANKFKQLGISVSSVKTAEDVFVKNTQAVCSALIARAKAEAYGELYKEKLKQKIKNDLNPSVDNGRLYKKQNRFQRSSNEGMAGVSDSDINWKYTQAVDENGDWVTIPQFASYKQSGLDKINAYVQSMARAKKGMEDNELNMLAMNMGINQQNANGILADLGILGTGGGGGGGRGGSGMSIYDKIRQAWDKAMLKSAAGAGGLKSSESGVPSAAWAAYAQSMAKDFEAPVSPLQKLNEQLQELRDNLENAPDTATYQLGLQAIADKEKEIAAFKNEDSAKQLSKDGKDASISWNEVRQAITGVGSALGGIENPASNIINTVAQAIANIALAYSEALAKDGGIKSNIWYFIASAAAATASMVATISSVHSATGYAQGGMITGNTYSGDQVPIMANAGEVVLTRAMQNNLASQLQDQSRASMMQPYVEGENVYLGMNNYTQRSGQGEIVTTGMLRRMGLM